MKKYAGSLFRTNAIFAYIFIIIGLITNEWILGSAFSELMKDGKMALSSRVFIVTFQIAMVTTGLLLYFKGNTPGQRRRLLFGYIMIMLSILLIECILHLFNPLFQFGKEKQTLRSRIILPEYQDQEWADVIAKEMDQVYRGYEPFLGYSWKSFNGQYMNINSNGMRKSWNPDNTNPTDQKKIFMFGGSTLWGWAARDEHTIPSYLSKILNENKSEYIVSNFGQPGYNFTQEVMKLVLLLRSGHRPDHVIFYDGANDVYGAYNSGKGGKYMLFEKIKQKVDAKSLTTSQHYVQAVKGTLSKYSMLYKSLKNITKLIQEKNYYPEKGAGYSEEKIEQLSMEINDYYLKSYDLLDRLSRAYGFKYYCFWQPVLGMEEVFYPPEDDKDYSPRLYDKKLCMIYKTVIDKFTKQDLDNFYVICDALRERKKAVYHDFCHISEFGNEMVASRIANIFMDSQ